MPRWIQNDLHHADDRLQTSYDQSLAAARELIGYCRRMEVPFGINVESVSIRLAEIEAWRCPQFPGGGQHRAILAGIQALVLAALRALLLDPDCG